MLSYRDEVRESELFRVAMELATAYQNTNYVQFFRLLKHRATYLQVYYEFWLNKQYKYASYSGLYFFGDR